MSIHLRVHSEFSIVDGTCRIEELVETAKSDGQTTLAITDFNNLFATVKFYSACRKAGIKPIIGCEIALKNLNANFDAPKIILLVKNHQGYLNLCRVLTLLWTQSANNAQSAVEWEVVAQHREGLILLSGGLQGPIGQAIKAGNLEKAQEWAKTFAAVFQNHFYLEVQRAGRTDDEAHNAAVLELASQWQWPVVATHPVQFLRAEDHEAHEARVCIASGDILGNPKRPKKFTRMQYFLSRAELAERFADIPSALSNGLEIAKRCNLTLTLGKPQLPDFPTPLLDGLPMSIDTYFRQQAQEGLETRLLSLYPNETERNHQRPVYSQRLAFEIDTILNMGFPGYFLIVSDFINWAKNHGCPVGPGRGSGAGSLVAYSLRITDLDPLKYNLLFERFLNPERVSMPDFDIDFCQVHRDRVIDYVKNRYGKDAVSQIVTFGTMAARAAIRDVGRTLDMSYTFCDGLSKLIPNKPGQVMTIAMALNQEPELAQRWEREDEVRQLLDLAQKLEGLTRNVGMHAGGVLIAPGRLTDFCPLYQQPGSPAAVSQFDKDDVESIGLVKFDFLGLATLTILEEAKRLISSRYPEHAQFQYESIPLDDPQTFELFSSGKTEAVFQFESRGMQAMLRDAKPSRLEDLIVLNALFRPGPMSLIPTFVARKHGRESVVYPHPLAEPILSETYGIMVYQEQVMQIAQVLAGYSLGGADLLRRAMGKKKPEEMALHRSLFREGAAKNQIDTQKADSIFDLMEEFAGYGFNKSHAAAYSLLAYHTAWIKVHFPAEFFSANMSIEMDDTDKLKVLLDDAISMGLAFENPDINHGEHAFIPISSKKIRYGLGAIKGTGQSAIEAIVQAREKGGDFKSLFDFCARVDRNRLNKRAVEALIKAGAFDSIEPNRRALLEAVPLAFEYAQSIEQNALQTGLFDAEGDTHGSSSQEPSLSQAKPWSSREKLTHEKSAIGFHLTGHLFDEVSREIRHFAPRSLATLSDQKEPQWLAGVVRGIRSIPTAKGRLNVFVIDDATASLEVSVEDGLFHRIKPLLVEDELVVVLARAQVDRRTGQWRISLVDAMNLAQARCKFGKYLKISLNQTTPLLPDFLRNSIKQNSVEKRDSSLPKLLLRLHLNTSRSEVEFLLGDSTSVFPSDEWFASLATHVPQSQSYIVYE